MIARWREAFRVPSLPFVYVELCTTYGAEEPKESNFWAAMRTATTMLPRVSYATTTDIQRALHPPDKQDVASRLLLALRNVAYNEDVVSRGPELVGHSSGSQPGSLVLKFSNSSLVVRAGILVGTARGCAAAKGHDSMVSFTDGVDHSVLALNYTIAGDSVTVALPPNTKKGFVRINADTAVCFLYSSESNLPAPPVVVPV